MNCFYFRSKQFFLNTFLLLTFVAGSVTVGFSQPDGGKIFKQNCARCHFLTDQKSTGPGLKGVFQRVPSEEWMFNWIKNNRELQKTDGYAKKVYADNGSVSMDVFDGILSDDDIRAVIAYVKNPPLPPASNGDGEKKEGGHKVEPGLSVFNVTGIVALVLLILVGVLGTVKKHLQDTVNAKKGLPPVEPLGPVKWASQNKRTVALVGLILVIVAARATYIGVMSIAVYPEYLPAQPIKYSHQTHAGKLQINCVYCHSGAEKGRTAGVPSANVCMNCHKAVQEGPKTGKAEIAKIYEAVGWNSEKGVYDKPEKPIKWVRVHNLPDFAYFNHSQHVVVGKQECATCHGDMTKVDEAKQHAPLTMGWCIDCHRKTAVPGMETNPYYEDLHAKLKEKYKGQPITVEKMGGLDCIKCHY